MERLVRTKSGVTAVRQTTLVRLPWTEWGTGLGTELSDHGTIDEEG